MSVDAEIRRLLTEQRVRTIRPPGTPVLRYQITSRRGEWEFPLSKGKFADEQTARDRIEKLRPKKGECFVLYDIMRGGPRGGVIMQKGECARAECAGDYPSLDFLFEREAGIARKGLEWPSERRIAARRLWLQWVKKLRQAASRAETVGSGKSSFDPDFSTQQLKDVLQVFCRGKVPMPQKEESGRFAALFELVLPGQTMGYPTGLAYTAQPVGSPRGTGVSPAAAGDIESGRFQNYLDAGIIKSRKSGSKSSGIGGGKVVQHQKARS